jgi:hypothetical protein
VALVVDPDGVVSAFGLAPANCDERPVGDALIAQDRHDAYLTDKGFSSTIHLGDVTPEIHARVQDR